MSITVFNPEAWLETAIRGIKDYTLANMDGDVYDVRMEFPGAEFDNMKVEFEKTIIHFELDDVADDLLGMGERGIEENFDLGTSTIRPQYGSVHNLNFDVGVWATDQSGGVTSRLRVKQHLFNLFGLPHGIDKLRNATAGSDGAIELLNFTGGRFAIDTVNDFRLYRIVDCQLNVRVFSRTPIPDVSEATAAIEEIFQDPDLTLPS